MLWAWMPSRRGRGTTRDLVANKDKKGVLICFLWCFHVCSTYVFVDFTLFSYDLHWSYMFSHVSVIKLFSLGLNCVHVLLFFCYLGLNYLFRAGSTMISDSQAWLSENATPLFQRMIIIHIIDPCKIPIFWYGTPTKIDNLGMI